MARCASAWMSPCTRIETLVPSRGRARSIRGDGDRIGGQQAFDPVGEVPAGKRGAGNVLDVLGEGQLRAMALAGELAAPGGISDLVAIGFPVFQDLYRFDAARLVQSQGEGNEIVLPDDLIGDEPATGGNPPDAQIMAAHIDAGSLFDRRDLRRRKL